MIIYTQTPDYYQEYLEHGWLKDQAAKVHKYLERWRGKNGKWYYRYTNAKASAQNALNTIKKEGKYLATKYKNKATKTYGTAKNMANTAKYKINTARTNFNRRRIVPERVSYNYGKRIRSVDTYPEENRWDSYNKYGDSHSGVPTSRSGQRGSTYSKEGVAAGRKRVADKKQAQEKEMARIREAFSAPEVRARALKNRKNYILKENYWNPKNDKRQAQLDSYKKKRKK